MAIRKPISKQITNRFLEERDKIVGGTGKNKVTAKDFAASVKMTDSNIIRLKEPGKYVTLEALGLICKHYNVSAEYLLTGKKPVEKMKTIPSQLENRLRKIEKALG